MARTLIRPIGGGVKTSKRLPASRNSSVIAEKKKQVKRAPTSNNMAGQTSQKLALAKAKNTFAKRTATATTSGKPTTLPYKPGTAKKTTLPYKGGRKKELL